MMHIFSVCTGIPKEWMKARTETKFPVDQRTLLTVSCEEGYINTGSKVVTCNTFLYQDYEYNTQPHCVLGKLE